jgi:2-iminobutanoate/2-iminopropanoate deaminase
MKTKLVRLAILFVLTLIIIPGCVEKKEELAGKQVIASENAPEAIGPYSQAIMAGNTLYCSGQIAIDPETGELVLGSIEEQTRQVLDNLGAVLKQAGMDYSNAVRATVFMDDMDNYSRINKIYAEYFKENPPARCAVEVARLPKDVGVEISLIAVKD